MRGECWEEQAIMNSCVLQGVWVCAEWDGDGEGNERACRLALAPFTDRKMDGAGHDPKNTEVAKVMPG